MAIEFMIGLVTVVAGTAFELWFVITGYRELDQILRDDQRFRADREARGEGPQTF